MTLIIARLFHFAECHYAECCVLYTIILNVIMLSVVILSVVMLSVIMLSVIMLSVVMLNIVMLSIVAPVFPSLLCEIVGDKEKCFITLTSAWCYRSLRVYHSPLQVSGLRGPGL